MVLIYFQIIVLLDFYEKGMEVIEVGIVDLLFEIFRGFEKDWVNGGVVNVFLVVNVVNGIKGGLGSFYLFVIVNDYGEELWIESGIIFFFVDGNLFWIDIFIQNFFNVCLDYKLFMVLVLMVMLFMMFCGFLFVLNIVGEKEVGMIEQINVIFVGKFIFIFVKLIFYWLIGFVVLIFCFVLVWIFYGIFFVGYFWVIYCFFIVFVLVVFGFGLVIFNYLVMMQ